MSDRIATYRVDSSSSPHDPMEGHAGVGVGAQGQWMPGYGSGLSAAHR